MNTQVVLASRSRIRSELLTRAGVAHDVAPADLDERSLATGLIGAERVAEALAEAKCLHIARRRPHALVIGADQVLEFEGALLSKVADLDAARARLRRFMGRAHRLVSAVALAHGDDILWSRTDAATIEIGDRSEAALEAYLRDAGEGLLASVACYEIEGLGARLIDAIEGDFFTALGLPLLPLLGALRREGAIE